MKSKVFVKILFFLVAKQLARGMEENVDRGFGGG